MERSKTDLTLFLIVKLPTEHVVYITIWLYIYWFLV